MRTTSRWLVVSALVACGKHDDAPRIKLDGGDVVASKADAAAPADAAVAVHEGPTVVQLAVGPLAACAAMSDGSARCWGDNAEGELGDGTRHPAPGPITPKLKGVKQVALGDSHACARLDDGSVACWGKIGFGAQASQLSPTAVPGVTNVKRLWSFRGASCAGDTAGKTVCWGDVDAAGHLTAAGAHRAPSAAVGLDHVVALTANVALRDDGDVALLDAAHVPVRVGAQGVVEVASFGASACGRHDDGSVECYGPDQPCARPGAATPPPAPAPAPAPAPVKAKKGSKAKPAKPKPAKPPPPPTGPRIEKLSVLPARALARGGSIPCVITTGGRLQCGIPSGGEACGSVAYAHFVAVAEAAGGCARLGDGSVRCLNVDRSKSDSTAIRGVAGATAIDVSGDRGCAIVGPRAVACWNGIGDARTIDL